MKYRRLPYHEYFVNTSEDYNHTGRQTYKIEYKAVPYKCAGWERVFCPSHEVNYEMHYEPERDVIQLNFQCTHGGSDWFANVFEFSSKYYEAITFEDAPLQLRVHHGWGEMYRAVKHEVRDGWLSLIKLHPKAHTEIIGWSLGSGLAILCCQDLNYNFGLKSYLYTFGSVRPFKHTLRNKEKTLKYLSTLTKKCLNFADVNDIITYMPPFRGFTAIRRVNVGGDERRTLTRLLKPLKYHTHYDRPDLYYKII